MTTIDNMTGVSMRCDWLFNSTKVLEFFPTHGNQAKKNRIALVYGKNESGKSTVAQGFREYIASTIPRTIELLPLANGSHMYLTIVTSLSIIIAVISKKKSDTINVIASLLKCCVIVLSIRNPPKI